MKPICYLLIIVAFTLSSCEKIASRTFSKAGTRKVAEKIVQEGSEKAIKRQIAKEGIVASGKQIERILFKQGARFHPVTGVEYITKKIGKNTYNNIALFPYKADIKLPQTLWKSTDKKQFNYCMEQLRAKIKADPAWGQANFTKKQTAQIFNGKDYCINGYTWHHSEEDGIMQLVENRLHVRTPHTGGRTIWGGGGLNR